METGIRHRLSRQHPEISMGAIDRESFAEECVLQGVYFRIEPHYLLAVAQLRSGISGDDDGDRKGPFRLTQAEWDANSNNDEFDIHFTPAQIASELRQCAVFGLMAHRAFDAFVSAQIRNPSALELYRQQWPDESAPTLAAGFPESARCHRRPARPRCRRGARRSAVGAAADRQAAGHDHAAGTRQRWRPGMVPPSARRARQGRGRSQR